MSQSQIKCKTNLLVLFTFISIVAVVQTGCKKHSPNLTDSAGNHTTIRIGEVGSMTGSEATFGTSNHNGVSLAIEELNAEGGVNGKSLELFTADDQSRPDEAATAVTQLIHQKNVIALLGEVASSRSLAMAPIAQQNKIPMITPSSTNPAITEMGDYIFRVCFIDPFEGEAMAKFAFNDLKIRKVAILKDIKSDHSTSLAHYFADAFKKAGGSVTAEQSYEAGNIDFKSQLTAIRAAKPDAIWVPGYYTEVGLIARQTRELGLMVPLLGGDGWDSPKLGEIGGKALDNAYFSTHFTSENQAPTVQNFILKYKAKFGTAPDGIAALGYDAAKVLAGAMKRAKTLSPSDIRDAIAGTKNYLGVTGTITIDNKRNAVNSAVVLQVKNGTFKYQTTVQP